jgi:hypothetical protein
MNQKCEQRPIVVSVRRPKRGNTPTTRSATRITNTSRRPLIRDAIFADYSGHVVIPQIGVVIGAESLD